MKINGTRQDCEMSGNQLIKLESNQASQVPFPPDCPVIVLEDENVMYSGRVVAVYISFNHNTGLCLNYYKVSSTDRNGDEFSEVVSGDQVRYAINCPIKVSSDSDRNRDDDTIEGIIRGFEIKSDDADLNSAFPSFLYTVEVTAYSSDGEETILRQRGVSAKHVRFHPVDTVAERLFETNEEKTSVVSLEDEKNSAFTCPPTSFQSPRAKSVGTFSPPCKMTPYSPSAEESDAESKVGSPQLVHENEGNETYTKCFPLSTPYPPHFQGKLDNHVMIPDFSFLTNFSPGNTGETPKGTKSCVMCGKIRQCSNGKSSKVKAMKSSEQYSQDDVIIPNQNKGICTLCDISVWVIKKSGTQIKWCKGCKNFKAWCTFGTKGSASKCLPCRERQKEKYAASKKRKMESPQTYLEAADIERSFKRPTFC